MDKAAAIITDVGGVTGHMASLAREFGVPAILDTGTATRTIKQGQEITVDAINCNVYEGRVEELIAYTTRKAEPLKDTPLLRMFDRVLGHIVSLHLVDPSGDNFNPQGCTTYHDITRFAHEKAMAEMFGMSDTSEVSSDHTIGLKAGIPLDAHLLDVGNGVTQGVKKADTGDILSIPFRAFVRGLKAMRWPEPRPADVKGFMGMMAHTATIPEEQLRGTAEKSFAIISSHYMNFSIRLGYHFSMVEAFAGDNRNDNYIKFFFKGGGASRDRRLRRVRLISEIITRLDFQVKVVEDVVDAVLLKFKKEDIEARLEALGRLTVFTKQLDMAMFNDAITDSYREDFVKSHLVIVPGLSPEEHA
jgi:pyruvate,water dikinase